MGAVRVIGMDVAGAGGVGGLGGEFPLRDFGMEVDVEPLGVGSVFSIGEKGGMGEGEKVWGVRPFLVLLVPYGFPTFRDVGWGRARRGSVVGHCCGLLCSIGGNRGWACMEKS